MKDTFQNAKETVKDYIPGRNDVRDTVRDTMRETKETAKDTFNQAKEKIDQSFSDKGF